MPITQAFGIPPVHREYRDNSVEFPCQLGLSIGFGGTIHHCREPLLVFHTSNNHMRMVISRDQTYYYTSGCGCAAGMWLSGALLRILWKKYDHPVVYHDVLLKIVMLDHFRVCPQSNHDPLGPIFETWAPSRPLSASRKEYLWRESARGPGRSGSRNQFGK